jgi:hypothetical protein
MWGQDLGLHFTVVCTATATWFPLYISELRSLMMAALYSLKLKHVAFYITIIKCWVLTDCFTVAYYKYHNKKSAGETTITHADVDRKQSSVIRYINIK